MGLEPAFEEKGKTALEKAMKKFKEVSEGQNSASEPTDVFSDAVSQASAEFGKEFKKLAGDIATEVDSYIKSAIIIIPPGIPVVGAGAGSTIAPSAPATIA